MKKRFIATAVVAGLLVAPYFSGQLAETEMRNMVAKMQSIPGVSVSIENYHSGWFNSTADVVLNYSQEIDSQVAPLEMKIISKQSMQHGPILSQSNGLGFGLIDIAYDFDLTHNQGAAVEFTHNFTKDKLESYMRIGYTGTMTSFVSLQPVQIMSADGNFDIKAFAFDSVFSRDGQLQFSGNWQGLDVTKLAEKVMSIGEMQFSADQQVVRGDIFSYNALALGDSNFYIKNIEMIGATAAESVTINDLTVLSTSHEENGFMYADVDINIDSINAIGQEFSKFAYQLSLNKLDLDVYQEFQNLMIQNNAQQDPDMLMMQMQAMLPELLTSGPELKITKLGMQTAQGEIASQLNIRFDQSVLDVNNPMTMFMALQADASGRAPIEFFNSIGMQQNIDQLLMQNMLVQDEEQVKFDFTFSDGQALLNGEPVPLG
ncbi:YdgA family protein [Thalassotalea sp. ND16A]|uniref:YdgA family protein n=1 Tax=Thalassotalea sp. ND16A TaxID=1535422 RepID=UPI00051A0468|nr:DUF945 family protein [Thalassotalea sp. ND16A]KGJ98080.1 hypothetical protein ND16A_0885 [Thalassotalea sp. ND16A]